MHLGREHAAAAQLVSRIASYMGEVKDAAVKSLRTVNRAAVPGRGPTALGRSCAAHVERLTWRAAPTPARSGVSMRPESIQGAHMLKLEATSNAEPANMA